MKPAKKTKGYYIFYDNSQSQKDHIWHVLAIAKTESAAKRELERLKIWIEETNEKLKNFLNSEVECDQIKLIELPYKEYVTLLIE